ncbi:MAG: SdrD B-like domain-containing protein, partial [Candidatus Zixiibacteriota bacterium]
QYTISVEKQGFGFDYEQATFTIDYSNPSIIHNIEGNPLSLCGTITLEGSPFASISVSLSGKAIATTTTDSNGYYSFEILCSGAYEIKPEKEYYGFNPLKKDLVINFDNPSPIVEFLASLLSLKGSLTTESQTPIENATITITGDYSTSAITDSSGSYYIFSSSM